MDNRIQLYTVLLFLFLAPQTKGQSNVNTVQTIYTQNGTINVMPYPKNMATGNGKLRINSQFEPVTGLLFHH